MISFRIASNLQAETLGKIVFEVGKTELVNYCSGHVTVDASVHFTQHILRSTPKTMHRVAAYKRRLARAGMFQ